MRPEFTGIAGAAPVVAVRPARSEPPARGTRSVPFPRRVPACGGDAVPFPRQVSACGREAVPFSGRAPACGRCTVRFPLRAPACGRCTVRFSRRVAAGGRRAIRFSRRVDVLLAARLVRNRRSGRIAAFHRRLGPGSSPAFRPLRTPTTPRGFPGRPSRTGAPAVGLPPFPIAAVKRLALHGEPRPKHLAALWLAAARPPSPAKARTEPLCPGPAPGCSVRPWPAPRPSACPRRPAHV